MNRVPVIVRNPAYIEELEPDEEAVNQDDVTPLVSGDAPTNTVPASEDKDVAEDVPEDDDEEEYVDDIIEQLIKRDEETKVLITKMMDIISSFPEDVRSPQPDDVPQVEVWDIGKAWEQEYRQYPNSDINEIRNRLSSQVWDLLQIMQERVDQHAYNSKDIKLIDGLNAISVMHYRISNLTDKVLKRQAEKPSE